MFRKDVIVPVAVYTGDQTAIFAALCHRCPDGSVNLRGDKNTAAANSLTPSVLALPSFFGSFFC